MKTRLTFIAISLCLITFISSCTRPNKARLVLERDGYTDIQIQGYYPFACSEDDTFSTGFVATKNDLPVKGSVCMGLMKGATIRILN